ncbi:MAG: LLM class flavin-dependent oxidoreductase [Solirubrobacterales bacterium]|nr:LLM class flavin-dependent oxidoreductase [Solirubrobacterales bacterium]
MNETANIDGKPNPVRLSVLDLAPVVEGADPAAALANSTELVRAAERLGYHRHWVAEHHNMTGIASSAPAVLIAHLAASSEKIRVGSGGVMLPNHQPLVVAEQFGMLESLHPGRIDLGIGRAPGTDQVTAAALRRGTDPLSDEDLPRQLGELLGFFTGEWPSGHPYSSITAVPGEGAVPEIWLLGSSGYTAQVAGLLGMPYSFAHHFSAGNTEAAVELYRSRFEPSAYLTEPRVMLGVGVICAETDEQARWLAGPSRLAFSRLRSGRPGRFPSPEEAAAHDFTPDEEAVISSIAKGHIFGSPKTVKAGLSDLIDRTGADELIISTMVYEQRDRLRSYELVADIEL